MNSIYNALNQKEMLNKFNEFRNAFQGDPKQEVQKLLDSGQMSQETFNRLSQMATQFQSLLK